MLPCTIATACTRAGRGVTRHDVPFMVQRHLATKTSYPHYERVKTRWTDNDAFGHVNNAVYYQYFDDAVNAHLMANGVTARRFVASSSCQYLKPLAYPQELEIGLQISRLGQSSATYAIGLFSLPSVSISGSPLSMERELCAEATYVHVYVDDCGRPVPMCTKTRAILEMLL